MSNCALDIDSIDDPDWLKARALMEKRSLKDCEEAAAIYEQCIARYSKINGIGGVDPQLFLEAAQSRNAVMRIKTHSNTLHITKMLDTPENKEVWKMHGPRAMELASMAKEGLSPTHPEAMVCYADAYFFANSVKGLLSAAVTGSGLTFKANSKELIQNCEHAEAGIGHAYLGAFFLMAPWPIYNARAAEKHLMAAYNIDLAVGMLTILELCTTVLGTRHRQQSTLERQLVQSPLHLKVTLRNGLNGRQLLHLMPVLRESRNG